MSALDKVCLKGFSGERAFLSNFCQREFTIPPEENPFESKPFVVKSAEHAFQCQKATTLEDFNSILSQPSPADAKYTARNIQMRSDWEDVKVDIMRRVLSHKFEDPELREMLLATGDDELVEENYWFDDFWGVDSIHNLGGQNWLGKILMEIRDSIRGEQADA